MICVHVTFQLLIHSHQMIMPVVQFSVTDAVSKDYRTENVRMQFYIIFHLEVNRQSLYFVNNTRTPFENCLPKGLMYFIFALN